MQKSEARQYWKHLQDTKDLISELETQFNASVSEALALVSEAEKNKDRIFALLCEARATKTIYEKITHE